MKKLNKLISLLLVFCLLIPSVPALALVNVEMDEEPGIAQNPPGTAEGVQCSQLDEKPGVNGVCCVGLELNAVGKCDEPSYNDPALVSCSSDENCSGGTACLPQSGKDLYSSSSPNTADKDELTDARNSIQAQLREVETQKENGGTCSHPRDCSSYSCVSGVCKEKLVCRFANEGEVALGNVKCAGDLVKGAGGRCELSPEAKNPVYIGLLKEAEIIPDDKNQCRYELDEETRLRSLIAMRSLRAMEWFLSTISLPAQEDCFQIIPVLKQEIGGTFLTTRKTILANFSQVLNGIETDYKTLIDAKTADPEKKVTIHNGEVISNGDLYTRQTSGVDNLLMLYRRNLLFESYESAMLATVDQANKRITSLAENMGQWKGGATSWNVAGRNVNTFSCEGSKYKVKKFLSWKTKYYDQIKDRWSTYYEVDGKASLNSDIIKKPDVANVLSLMSGKKPEEIVNELTSSKFYMIDPMMFSKLTAGSYGEPKALKKKSSFLGLFGGFKDLRKAYYINGNEKGSLTQMHSVLRPGLKDFYKALKATPDTKGFVYEPELLTTEAKDCLDNPASSPACGKFDPFLEGVLDEAFAHFLAYSYHKNDSYEGFFENATSYRRRLLTKLQVDMDNISKYYAKVIETRQLQNTCIEKIAKGLADSDILAEGDKIKEGLIEGQSVLPGSTVKGTLDPLGKSTKPLAANSLIPKFDRKPYSFDLASNTLKDIRTSSLNDKLGTNSGAGSSANLDSSFQSAMAMRSSKMNNANSKAKSAGVKVADKEKAVSDVMRSMSKSSFGGSGSMSSANQGSFGSGFNNGSFGGATLGADVEKENKKKDETATGAAGEVTSSGTQVASVNPLAGVSGGAYGGGSDSGLTNASDANALEKDLTGLTDADKDRLRSAYEANKSEYVANEEDGIFKKVSKAYVRNLDKVLTKKKKIE